MALTDYDKKNLSTSDQQKIEAATKKWNEANAKGDKAGMQAAANEAAAVRNNAGYKTDTTGKYAGSYTPTSYGSSSGSSGGTTGGTTSGGNSQYTGSSTGVVTHNSTQQAIKDQMNANSIAWWSADENERKRLEAENQKLAGYLGGSVSYNDNGYWSGTAEGADVITKDDIIGWIDDYTQGNQQPTYNNPYDPQMQAMLNEILNRDNFSYDAMNDPLYQQYAAMYQREGDRAMQETLAEAAAGAGGMNSYAITAAQQANNYYNSQLNDKIPELYQLAYDMYLNDIDSKVRDLGLLQNMDATQYARYQDTMNNWYNDRNFAYGAYQDAINQSNWQTQFDYDSMIDNRDFNYNDYWKNKEWDASQGQLDIENSRYDREQAEEKMFIIINSGGTPSDELITQAGWNKADVEKLVAQAKKEKQSGGKISGGNSSSSGSNQTGNNTGDTSTEGVADAESEGGINWDDYTITNRHDENGVYVEGLGNATFEELQWLVDKGKVVEVIDNTSKNITYRTPTDEELILSYLPSDEYNGESPSFRIEPDWHWSLDYEEYLEDKENERFRNEGVVNSTWGVGPYKR